MSDRDFEVWERYQWPATPDAETVARDAEVVACLAGINSGALAISLVAPDELTPEIHTVDGWALRVHNNRGGWGYLEAYRRPGETAWRRALSYEVPDPERDADEETEGNTRFVGSAWWRPSAPNYKERWTWERAATQWW